MSPAVITSFDQQLQSYFYLRHFCLQMRASGCCRRIFAVMLFAMRLDQVRAASGLSREELAMNSAGLRLQ